MTPKEAKKLILEGKAPKNLTVDGSLDLIGCTALTALPEGLCVDGSLLLQGCTALKSLQGIKSVGGTIYVDEDLIKRLPLEELPLLINFEFEEKIKRYIMGRYSKETNKEAL